MVCVGYGGASMVEAIMVFLLLYATGLYIHGTLTVVIACVFFVFGIVGEIIILTRMRLGHDIKMISVPIGLWVIGSCFLLLASTREQALLGIDFQEEWFHACYIIFGVVLLHHAVRRIEAIA